MKKVCLIAGIVLLSALIFNQEGLAEDQILEKKLTKIGQKYVPGEIIVKFKPGTGKHVIANLNSSHGASVFYTSRLAGFKRLRIPRRKTVSEMVKIYKRDPNVEYVEPNYIAYAFWTPNDEYYSYQWHLDNADYGGIEMEEAWGISTGSGVIVAIIDTGIAYEDNGRRYKQAPDLAGTCFVGGYDFVYNDTHPNDDEGHGTHVAGTVAQSTNNSIGVAGIAFNACLMPIKVLDRYGSGTYADVAEGIHWAVDHSARVINLSLGGSAASTTLEEAVAYAYNKGVTVVAAAGNDGENVLSYPAAYDDYVIAVGATRYDETLAYYSNFGPGLDLVAPGGDLNVDQNGDGYGDGVLQETFQRTGWRTKWGYYFMSGTSMAAPHVSGVAALVVANGNATTPDEVRAALQETAEDLGDPGPDDIYGWGIVNAYAALNWTAGPVDDPPSVSITSPLDGITVSGQVSIEATASDDVGVVRIDFYADGTCLGTDDNSPYSISWNSTAVVDGTYQITATAIDTAFQSSSDSISVIVDNVNDSPVAEAGPDQTVSDADGNGTETVTLDGSASYDPDGTISSYEWAEGTTVLGTGAVITYDFSVGSHTVTLTVTDDRDASAGDDALIIVEANQAPVAEAGPDQTAAVGQTVNFDGSGSSDPDGIIMSYNWDFGDGMTETGETATHAYSAADSYTVTLTVTDDGGLTNVDTASVTVTEAAAEIEVFYDSFEVGEWNGLWTEDSQNDWFRSKQRAVDGVYSAEVDGRATDAQLISIPINLQRKTNATITFSWYIEKGLDKREYLAFDISTDGGANWVEKASLKGNVDPENTWHDVNIDLTGINSLRIRFRGKMSNSREDANLDTVKVIAW